MRRSFSLITLPVAIAVVLTASGCKEAPENQTAKAEIPAPAAPVPPSPAPAAASASASASVSSVDGVKIAEETELYEFNYSYPAEAAAIAGLRQWLERDTISSRREITEGAKEDQASRSAESARYTRYSLSVSWEKVAQIGDFLSLSAGTDIYLGGAHGMQGFQSLVWDGRAGQRLEPAEMFDEVALDRAIRADFCDALDAERSKRRQMPVNRDSGDGFDACIAPLEQTLIVGSTDGKAFNRLGILIGPYAAGSYAEGTFEITLPVTSAVMRSVKPQYRGIFAPQ